MRVSPASGRLHATQLAQIVREVRRIGLRLLRSEDFAEGRHPGSSLFLLAGLDLLDDIFQGRVGGIQELLDPLLHQPVHLVLVVGIVAVARTIPLLEVPETWTERFFLGLGVEERLRPTGHGHPVGLIHRIEGRRLVLIPGSPSRLLIVRIRLNPAPAELPQRNMRQNWRVCIV